MDIASSESEKKACLVTAEQPFKFGMIFPAILMCIWNIPNGLKFFAFYFSGISQMGSPIFMSNIIADDWAFSDVRDTVFVDKYHSTIQSGRAKFEYQLVYDYGILLLYLGKYVFTFWCVQFLTWVQVPLFTFPTVEAPEWRHGYPPTVVFAFVQYILVLFGMWYMNRNPAAQENLGSPDIGLSYSGPEESSISGKDEKIDPVLEREAEAVTQVAVQTTRVGA